MSRRLFSMRSPLRSVSLIATFCGAVFNIILAVRVLAAWRSLRWDFESDWEGSEDGWRIDAVKLVWGLLSLYFAAATTASVIGFVGIAKRSRSYVRFFRDYSIADFVFVVMCAAVMSYVSFSSSTVRAGVCEELGRQPDLLRDLADSGLSLENCEYWLERGVVVVLGIMLVFVVIRLHFVLALSKYYSQLRRDQHPSRHLPGLRTSKSDKMQRIYLLPTPTSPSFPSFNHHTSTADVAGVVVYAPIPVGNLSAEEAKEMHATEAWISTPPAPRSHRHSHSRHHRHHSHSHFHSPRQHSGHRSTASVPNVTLLPYRDEDEVMEPLAEKVDA